MQNRRALATQAIAVIAVVIVAVVAGAAFVVLSSPGSSSSTSSSSSSPPLTTTTSSTSATSSTPMTTTSSTKTTTATTSSTSTTTTPTTSSQSSTSTSTASTSCLPSLGFTSQPASVFVPQLSAYSSIGGNFQVSVNQTSNTFTSSYTTVYASATTFKVSIVASDYPSAFTLWLLRNGTIAGINYAGSNYTGAAANQYYQGSRLFTTWGTMLVFGQQLTTDYIYDTAYFHSTGTSPVTIGTNTFTLTNYAAKSLPETVPSCGGASITLTTASMSIGTPNRANYPFPFDVDIVGSATGGPSAAGTTTFTITSQITSITVA